MILLLIAGIGAIFAGLVAIALGIPVKEFGFGNTLILTGTIGACTGLLMIGLAIVVREIRNFAPSVVEAVPTAAPPTRREPLAKVPDETEKPAEAHAPRPLFSRDQPAAERAGVAAPDVALHQNAEEPAAVEPPPEEPKRRNLLFSSTRRERERADAERATRAGEAPEPAQARPSFAESWPATERTRPELPRRPRAPAADSASDEQLIPERYVPPTPPRRETAPPASDITVLKSGVVDGMAYSLYSDGSIEAQMPEGMMRFASINELRDHLDQRA